MDEEVENRVRASVARGTQRRRAWRSGRAELAAETELRRSGSARRERGKAFSEYARQSFIDTLTLYLHGICCDIDVDTGPRQLPSRYLRRRLMLLEELFPPPKGYVVFPEHLGS